MPFIDSYSKSQGPVFADDHKGQDKIPYRRNAYADFCAANINNRGKIRKSCGDLDTFVINFYTTSSSKLDEIVKAVGVDFISIDGNPLGLADRDAFEKLLFDIRKIVNEGTDTLNEFVRKSQETITNINAWLLELGVNYDNYSTTISQMTSAYNRWQGLKSALESGNVSRGTGYADITQADVNSAYQTYDNFRQQSLRYREVLPIDGNKWVKGTPSPATAPQRPDYLT